MLNKNIQTLLFFLAGFLLGEESALCAEKTLVLSEGGAVNSSKQSKQRCQQSKGFWTKLVDSPACSPCGRVAALGV